MVQGPRYGGRRLWVGYPSFVAQADGEYVHNTYTAGGGSASSLVALMRRAL